MTNGELYTTPEARSDAFAAFCDHHFKKSGCLSCPHLEPCRNPRLEAAFYWLERPADEQPTKPNRGIIKCVINN